MEMASKSGRPRSFLLECRLEVNCVGKHVWYVQEQSKFTQAQLIVPAAVKNLLAVMLTRMILFQMLCGTSLAP